ncbi:hypothetical protein J6590_106318 [Homalodisca vitripennis]|nr:hypothetical protein J6590_106318 [Homalodisca vitripennis]
MKWNKPELNWVRGRLRRPFLPRSFSTSPGEYLFTESGRAESEYGCGQTIKSVAVAVRERESR